LKKSHDAARLRFPVHFHNGERIEGIEVNGEKKIETDQVVSTLPLGLFLKMMTPSPPERLCRIAESLRYRNLILTAFFLDKPSVTNAATIYFPDREIPFTRVYEPRNRSPEMSPHGKTSLVAEVPCQPGDDLWSLGDQALIGRIKPYLIEIGWIREEEVLDALTYRIHYAYPILELHFEEKLEEMNGYLRGFRNLQFSGRSGKFVYAWLHNMMRFGKEIVQGYLSSDALS